MPVARVRDRLEADGIVALLRDAGIEAIWRVPRSPALDGLEETWMGTHYGEILVLDSNLARAQEILAESRDVEP